MIRERIEKNELNFLHEKATKSVYTKGRKLKIEPCEIRTIFQRDRDRIIHSTAFRRLKDKTQVFIAPASSHYRTRLTHTLEVAQISRSVSRGLRLNEDLTEAIALGHDLGHTPYGHAGERVLDRISSKGFRHNEQSLRVVDVIEKGKGLNLSYEVRDGILHHRGNIKAETPEGQVVAICDRIAYINHDIDDSIRGGILKIEDLPKECVQGLGIKQSQRINTMIKDLINNNIELDKPLSMSEEIGGLTNKLRDFMFEKIYISSIAKNEEKKAEELLEKLFFKYMEKPEMMSEDYKKMIDIYGVERVVTDYIAGMTDRFAQIKFSEMFLPMGWQKI